MGDEASDVARDRDGYPGPDRGGGSGAAHDVVENGATSAANEPPASESSEAVRKRSGRSYRSIEGAGAEGFAVEPAGAVSGGKNGRGRREGGRPDRAAPSREAARSATVGGRIGRKKGRSCDRPGGRKSGGEVVLAAKCGGEGGDVFERRTHVQRRRLENGALGAVPHHVLAGDDPYPSGRLGGDLRAGEVNRGLHGGRADRGDGGKCREGPGKINFVRPIYVRRDLWGGN